MNGIKTDIIASKFGVKPITIKKIIQGVLSKHYRRSEYMILSKRNFLIGATASLGIIAAPAIVRCESLWLSRLSRTRDMLHSWKRFIRA